MNYLLLALSNFAHLILVIVYGTVLVIELHKRSRASSSVDVKMNSLARVTTWSTIILSIMVMRSFGDNVASIVFVTILLALYFLGSRLWVQSYKLDNEKKEGVLYAVDQWVLAMYKKYFNLKG